MNKKYYRLWHDDTQSIWLVIVDESDSAIIYRRTPCSISGPLTKVDYMKTTLTELMQYHKVQEITEKEALSQLT